MSEQNGVAAHALSTNGAHPAGHTVLAARDLSSGYQGVPAIREVNAELRTGEIVLLAGPNGAGKSTTVMTLAGAIKPIAGSVEVDGSETHLQLYQRTRGSLGVITEKRAIFNALTVRDNLRLGRGSVDKALELFPELEKRIKVRAGLLSGGEQQMLSLARVLAANPKVILADELSLGLAPIIVKRLLSALRAAANSGAAVLLVEQHVQMAMDYVDRGYFMSRGRVGLEGDVATLRKSSDRIQELYL
jgi:branched-chain amino acid transport system ATP-binding protein